ncbi:CRISPR-associated protein Csb2 [Streptoalloteichus tenebrarius]|uniref:CRISPR-associated protein Csb2 n=1 Tax=Streptoalloteichus tenebrarius (strain ATCC 17920 / DSM 40477 / JCM 4838 / CBS 697.72 / NBRC 16177 / NCIMB 11028 / NRRL B-12390 / A12253. 1 / ISP 5477) TaxID=1933 RepID=A0ABT1I1H7_STRSD|nr:type I-U CRISPR-associated protein Csb2 [Streptoalloteichus tenebrarius]MCP2261643.1 CRISPR-associated protein Csb2 [Streptoalloteichus tenebrarius]BFE99172.1 hypothetical protein GCM10020241_08480 [Streptoalloteichus tenebrarius]
MLAVQVRLLHGRFEAGVRDPRQSHRQAEWPPHPARLHCALRASATNEGHGQLLRWLEEQTPPQVWAERVPVWAGEHASYVVTGKVKLGGGNQFFPGRTNGLRRRAHAVLATSGFAFVWPDLNPDGDRVEALRELTARVPYFGRSTSAAVLTVHTEMSDVECGEWVRFVPDPDDHRGGRELTVACPGYTDALEETYAMGSPAWTAPARAVAYGVLGETDPEPEQELTPVAGPHREMVMFAFPRGVRIDGVHAGMVTARLRQAVMSRVPDPLPPQVSGHGADDRPHVAYLPILDVAHRHARGHLLGVAVALPEMNRAERVAVLRALWNRDAPLSLRLGEIDVELLPEDHEEFQQRGVARLRETWWRQPSTTWATVTPIVVERFCGPDGVEEEIGRSCRRLGLPTPVEVIPAAAPLVRGGAMLRRRHLPRKEAHPRPMTHALLRFPTPVGGPVAVGAQRYLGMGLCAPLPREEAPSE